jgi:hypothetical protein
MANQIQNRTNPSAAARRKRTSDRGRGCYLWPGGPGGRARPSGGGAPPPPPPRSSWRRRRWAWWRCAPSAAGRRTSCRRPSSWLRASGETGVGGGASGGRGGEWDWGAAAEGGGRRTDRSGAGGQVYMVARDGGAAVVWVWTRLRILNFEMGVSTTIESPPCTELVCRVGGGGSGTGTDGWCSFSENPLPSDRPTPRRC